MNCKKAEERSNGRSLVQGTHCTGKTEKMAKKIPVRETQGNWKFCQNTGKTQGISFAQVVNSLMPKVKNIAIFAAKISIFSPEAG